MPIHSMPIPFAPPDGKKICTRCWKSLDETDENFYRYPNGNFRNQCKECHNKETVQYRRERRQGVRPRQAKCAGCGYRTGFAQWQDDTTAFCPECAKWLPSFGTDASLVMDAIRINAEHLADVETRRANHKSDKQFIPHPKQFWDGVPMWGAADHRDCVRMGEKLRGMLRYVVKQSAGV